MLSKITVWYMTEEERLEYIKLHPIKPTKKPRRSDSIAVDYKWRSKKAADSRWGDGYND